MSRIFIGRVDARTRAEDIEDAFKVFGRINRFDFKGSFAFIEYEDVRDAEDAIKDMNGRKVDSSTIVVEMARGKPRAEGESTFKPRSSGFRVTVEGISGDTSWQDLKDFARTCARPIYTNVENGRDGEKVGVIEFETEDDMDRAIRQLSGETLHGHHVRLERQDAASGPSAAGERSGGGDYDRGAPPAYDRGGGGGYSDRPRDRGYGGGARDYPPARDDYDRGYGYGNGPPSRYDDRDRGGYRDREYRPEYRDRDVDRAPPTRRSYSDDRAPPPYTDRRGGGGGRDDDYDYRGPPSGPPPAIRARSRSRERGPPPDYDDRDRFHDRRR